MLQSEQSAVLGECLLEVSPSGSNGGCLSTYEHRFRINVKLGGINVIPKPDTARFLTDPANPTLVLGADVLHPGPRVEGQPSIAAVVGNVDSNTSKYVATSRAQRARQEMIEELDAMVYVCHPIHV